MTRNEVVSRLRNTLKEVNADTKYSNRYLWNVFWTNSKILLKRESERTSLYNDTDIWQTICVKMDKVSPLLCDCLKLPMDCIVYRSRFKVPVITEGSYGRIYRFISSADLSTQIVLVTPYQYQLKATKYNQEKYAFFHDGYLWAPNTKWSHIIISALFDEEIDEEFRCDCEEEDANTSCGKSLNLKIGLPDNLIQPAISLALQELGASRNLINDENPNISTNEKQVSI